MRPVVVTGMGVVSSIGNNKRDVDRSLRHSHSGIRFFPELRDLGFRCQVAGRVKDLKTDHIDKRSLETMSDVARYAAVAALEAVEDAGLDWESVERHRVGVILGTGAGGMSEAARAEIQLELHRDPARLGKTGVAKIMNSTAALNLAALLGIRGRCYSVSSACATGTDNIGHGFELIASGLLDVCICGSSEENCFSNALGFADALLSMPTEFNEQPERACRPYDRDRNGLVISEGAGVVILETLEHAERRGGRAYAEVLAYASANDGDDVFEPNGRGLRQCIERAMASIAPARIDYVNTHGPGTLVGDKVEAQVIRDVFGDLPPLVSSTKGLTGHASAAAGAHEAVYSLLMIHHGYVAPTANLENVAQECMGIRHVQSLIEIPLKTVMSFNSGLGGANACVVFSKV